MFLLDTYQLRETVRQNSVCFFLKQRDISQIQNLSYTMVDILYQKAYLPQRKYH